MNKDKSILTFITSISLRGYNTWYQKVTFLPPQRGGGRWKLKVFFIFSKNFKKIRNDFFPDVTFFYSRNTVTSSKIYRTSDLENTMNRLLEDRSQWTPFWRSENGLIHYIQGHDFDQINSFLFDFFRFSLTYCRHRIIGTSIIEREAHD